MKLIEERIKNVYNSVETIIDKETGEIIDISTNKIDIVVSPQDFCLVYADFWNILLGSPLSKSDVELFAYLVSNYSDGTPFTINSYTKKQVSESTNKSITSYNNSTRQLLEHKLIFSMNNTKVYKINPRYAFKGSSKNRHKSVIEMRSYCKDC